MVLIMGSWLEAVLRDTKPAGPLKILHVYAGGSPSSFLMYVELNCDREVPTMVHVFGDNDQKILALGTTVKL